MVRRFLFWLVLDGPYLGPLAPLLLGLALGSRPHQIEEWEQLPEKVICPECEALIPNDGACWYCENNPAAIDKT